MPPALIPARLTIGFGLIPLVAPTLFRFAPDRLHTLLDGGILLASSVAVALNAFFNAGHRAVTHDPAVVADHV